MKKKKHIDQILIVLIVVCILVAGVSLFLLFKAQQSASVSKKDGADGNYSSQKTNSSVIEYEGQTYLLNSDIQTILFLGVDQTGEAIDFGYGNGLTGGRSDCIMLLMLNKTDKSIKVLNISRDSMADVDVYGIGGGYITTITGQITMQYAYGEGTTQSCLLTKKAVSNLLMDVPIDSYFSLNMEGMSTVVDSLGGITMTIPDDYTYIDPSFTKGATIDFDGALAERYVRYRDTAEDGSNNGRMVRQDQFVRAFVSKIKQLNQSNSSSVQSFLDAAKPYMVTDMSTDEIKQLSSNTLVGDSYHLPGENVYGNGHDEFWVDEDGLEKLVIELLYTPKDTK